MVTKIRESLRVLILSMFLALVFSSAFSVWSADRIAHSTSNDAVCQILQANIDAYKQSPPQTPLGKNIQARYVQLYEESCK